MSEEEAFDPRLTPARPDLAAAHLRGRIAAPRFAEGVLMRVVATHAPLRREPRADASLDTQLLCGEAFILYDRDENGHGWGQSVGDGYVGYVPLDALDEAAPEPNRRVSALRTPVYPGPSLKLPTEHFLSLGAGVHVLGEENGYARISFGNHGTGYVHTRHLAPRTALEPDHVAVAERFMHAPYLWGGRTSLGLDCSGLVQLALAAAGIPAPRDTDMQEARLGVPLPVSEGLHAPQRGDLVFWKGHVGIIGDDAMLIHANGHHMAVAREPLAEAVARIARNSYGPVTAIRRLQRPAGIQNAPR
jgi:cell wall-associated NlpC family hydrolase